MRKAVLALAAATALCGASAANAVVTIDFGSAPGNLGPDHTYSTGVGNVVASGYNSNNSDADLYGKNFGGDEQGLGLASEFIDGQYVSGDPSGQNEIYQYAYIQLDVSDILASTTAASFFMGSTTNGEEWGVIGSNTDACDPLLGCSDYSVILLGTDELTWHALTGWGTFNYYDFFSLGTNEQAPGNVLLGGLSVTPSVPEPATWAMMLLGFGAVGFALRRKRRPALLTQIA